MSITFNSYNLNGTKDSFADWISDISPIDTFLVSTSKKESTPSNIYKWQHDSLDEVVYDLSHSLDDFASKEGADADLTTTPIIGVKSTKEESGVTQIFSKTFAISDSALSSSVHGRENELKLQLSKAGKELKNAMEIVFSSKQVKQTPDASNVAKSSGLLSLIADINVDNPALPTPATAGDNAVHKAGDLNFSNIDAIAQALYRSGSNATYILVNPENAQKINAARDEAVTAKVAQLSVVDKTIPNRDIQVSTITDSRGKSWEIIYSRFCPVDLCYFIDPEAIKQRVLREPKATKLGKNGSYEEWMLVIEAGLVLANPYSCGVLEIGSSTTPVTPSVSPVKSPATATSGTASTIPVASLFDFANSTSGDYTYAMKATYTGVTVDATTGVASIAANATAGTATIVATNTATPSITAEKDIVIS